MNTKNIDIKVVMAAIIGIAFGAAGGLMVSHAGYTYEQEGGMIEQHVGEAMMHGDTENEGLNMQGSMDSMVAGLKGKAGDAFDQAFLAAMIVHHQGAVLMAQSALEHAKHQEIKDLAQRIITAQNAEIAQMQGWQKTWYGSSSSESH